MWQLLGKKKHNNNTSTSDMQKTQREVKRIAGEEKQLLLSLVREWFGSPLFPSLETVERKLQDFIHFSQI